MLEHVDPETPKDISLNELADKLQHLIGANGTVEVTDGTLRITTSTEDAGWRGVGDKSYRGSDIMREITFTNHDGEEALLMNDTNLWSPSLNKRAKGECVNHRGNNKHPVLNIVRALLNEGILKAEAMKNGTPVTSTAETHGVLRGVRRQIESALTPYVAPIRRERTGGGGH